MIPGFLKIQFGGLFFWVVISVGVFETEKMVVISFCLFLMGVRIFRLVSDFTRSVSVGFKNRILALCKPGRDALLVRCQKVKTKVHCQKQGLA